MKILGDFEYDPADILGNGAFAIVYKGRFRVNPAIKVAIKIMLKDQNIIKAKSLLGKEISVLKDLNHDHIISASGVYLVMEYCNCGDLSEYLQSNNLILTFLVKKTLQESTIKHILFQIGSAMDAMNKKKIMHRDLKPGNILLSYFGDIKQVSEIPGNQIVFKLADFGFARFLQSGMMAVTMCGSPMYMAPEVLMSKKYDALADIWSMGIIVYQCLTGKAAFYANTPEALKKIYETNFNLRPKIPESCSPELADLLIKMLKRDPSRRIDFDNFLSHPFIQKGSKKCSVPQPKLVSNLMNKPKVTKVEVGAIKTLPGTTREELKFPSNSTKNIRNNETRPKVIEQVPYSEDIPARNLTISESLLYEYSPTLNFNYDSSQNLSEEFRKRDDVAVESDGYLYDDDEMTENRINFPRNNVPTNDDFIIINKADKTPSVNRYASNERNPPYPQSTKEHSIASPNQSKPKYHPPPLQQNHQIKFSSEIASIVRNQGHQDQNLIQKNTRQANEHTKLETIVGSPSVVKNQGFVEQPENVSQPHQPNDHFLGLGIPKHHLLDGAFSIESEDPQHCEELNKIIMVLELCELLSELAERRAAALSDCTTANNNDGSNNPPSSSSPSKPTLQFSSEAQRIVEQIVLYKRILYYLEYVFVQVKKGIEIDRLKRTDSSIKRICECNSLYHRSYIRLRQLAKQIQRVDLASSISYQLTCITANRLIYQHTFDQCLAAEMDEYIGEIRLCLQRYNAAIILLHGLTQHAKTDTDKLFLNNCMKMIRERSTTIWNQHSNQEFSTQNIVFNEFLPGLGDVPPLYLTKSPNLQGDQFTSSQPQAQ